MPRLFPLIAALLLLAAPPARAEYPTHPVTLVVAFTPGGPSDVLARIVGKKVGELLGQPFVIENRPGAGGNIAAEVVARAAPDGHTLLMGNNSILATNASLYKKLGYDAEKDFAPISLIGAQANILVVNPAVPAKSMAELIALAKQQPGTLNFASSGYGTAAHLAGELFKTEAHIEIQHVAYKGAAPALQDVIAGHVQMMFATAASVIGHIQGGLVRPLAVTTLNRTPVLPDIPTVDELGLPGFDAATWHGLVAPAGTPKDVIASLHRATVQALADPAGAQIARRARRRHRGLVAGRIRRLHQIRNPEMARGRCRRRSKARLMPTTDTGASAHKIRRLAHLDVPGAGQVTIAGNHAYVGHIPNNAKQLGTTIIDIADPYHPRVVATVTLDDPASHSHKVRVVGDVMIVNHERNMTPVGRRAEQLPAARAELSAALGREPSAAEIAAKLSISEADLRIVEAAARTPYQNGGFKIYDVANPAQPKPIAYQKTGGIGVHRFAMDARYAYISTEMDGFIGNILVVYDIAIRYSAPREVSRWWMGGCIAGGETPRWSGKRHRLHHALRFGDEFWASCWHGGFHVVDCTDIARPRTLGSYNYHPPFPEPTHTVMPVPARIGGNASRSRSTRKTRRRARTKSMRGADVRTPASARSTSAIRPRSSCLVYSRR